MKFEVQKQSSKARAGLLTTRHGVIETPVFMPVGTQATVKAMTPEELQEIGAQIILANTYHLFLRPGSQLIEKLGHLHHFMHWEKPILTDSGGYQVYSLNGLGRVTQDGVHFQSHLDGTHLYLTPEKSMEIQKQLGSDIVMCFDECTAYPATFEETRNSMALSLEWAKRCGAIELNPWQALFGIVQGGMFKELRGLSASCMKELEFQ